MLFFTLIFSLINVSSALKALFLDYNVRMLCEFNPFFAHNICLHGKIHFIYLFTPNREYRYVPHTANHPKNTEI